MRRKCKLLNRRYFDGQPVICPTPHGIVINLVRLEAAGSLYAAPAVTETPYVSVSSPVHSGAQSSVSGPVAVAQPVNASAAVVR